MAVGGEVTTTPPFADQAIRHNNLKTKNNVSSGFQILKFDRPAFFNNSFATPLSAEKKRIGPLTRRNTTTTVVRSDLAQQSELPRHIDDINKAKQRLDASARDGDPWVLITCDDQGRISGLSDSCSSEFYQRVQQAFSNEVSIAQSDFNSGLAITAPDFSFSNRNEDIFSRGPSRRTSLLAEGGYKRELSPMNRKRSSEVLDNNRSLSPDDNDQQCSVVSSIVYSVGAVDAINTFYTTTFKAIQQQALKQILKAWIKELEPHKQKHHPYKGGNLPDYWPAQIPFVEPDHQRTEDRIAVAINIIQFVQTDSKWSYNGIDTLESSTSNIKLQFDEEPQEKLGKRQRLLRQLYEVARQQGLWMKGEKDGEDPISIDDPIETMRVKRQPRAKRQKTARHLSQSCESSISESPDIGNGTQFNSSQQSEATITPMTDYCPTFAPQFHSEPEQSLPAQHTNNQNGWNTPEYNHNSHANHSISYGVAGLPQQPFPFSLPGFSSVAGQTSGPMIENMQFHYPSQAHSPQQSEFPATPHGLSDMTISGIPVSEIKMASQTTAVYPVYTEEQRWESTPAGYPPPHYQSHNDQLGHF